MSTEPATFTGIRRRRQTRSSVKVANNVARALITSAGIGTIIAVSLVCVFLIWVVLPLFREGEIVHVSMLVPHGGEADRGSPPGEAPIHVEVDEYKVLAFSVYPDSTIEVLRIGTGEIVGSYRIFPDEAPACVSFELRGGHVVFGFEDGTVRLGTITFETTYHDIQSMDGSYATMVAGEVRGMGEGVVELTPLGQFRRQTLAVDIKDPIELGTDSPVRLVDMTMLSSGPVFCALTEDGVLRVNAVREIRNIMTQTTRYVPSGGEIELPAGDGGSAPAFLMLEGRGDSVLVVWEDGRTLRYDTRDKNALLLTEQLDLAPDDGVTVTALSHLIGKMTVVVGDSAGRVSTWFRVKPTGVGSTPGGGVLVAREGLHPPIAERLRAPSDAEIPEALAGHADGYLVCDTPDASVLVRQHVVPTSADGQAVRALSASKRNRMLAVGFDDGRFDVVYVTSRRLLGQGRAAESFPVRSLCMTPKNDGLLAGSADGLSLWRIDVPHPETTPASIFGKVWYEGAEGPAHVWQSTAGDDAFESKYGLVPLIFGTLKATLYTILFGAPIALLAAVYTSEFLDPKAKSKIKPTVEIMASLPSVVLGFLAALVFAPFIEDVVQFVLLLFVLVPGAVLFSAFLWQLLPYRLMLLLNRARFPFILITLPIGGALAWLAARGVEDLLFAGDIRGWLAWKPDPAATASAGPFRSPVGGWALLLFPLSALAVTFVVTSIVNPRLREMTRTMGRHRASSIHLAKFAAGCLASIVLALGLAAVLDRLGLDPRSLGSAFGFLNVSPTGTYIQRNALIVGFVMGFAVIPIIYTLAEDALSAVPDHLRAASLGAGATRWQTAIRIVIPTAMSGIFSACMIGLGRAVGETMIVLMAAGNTPIMDLNMFSGFRTLSANIAVELPEAVENGTNYRMLFLAALTLFIMTFVLNTVAEVIRQRFRKRAFQL